MDKPEPLSFSRTPLKTIKVHARDEDFRIVQLQGNLFVCSKAHGNCCCGWSEKGRASVNIPLYEQEWENRRIRNRVHLSFTGCLGPCAVGNNALLQLSGRSIWFKDLNDDKYIPIIFDFLEALLKDVYSPVPPELAEHVFERFLPTPPLYSPSLPPAASVEAITPASSVTGKLEDKSGAIERAVHDDDEASELERIDPVCLMEVDPTNARFSSQFGSRNFYFCAPGCKKTFDKEPQAYL